MRATSAVCRAVATEAGVAPPGGAAVCPTGRLAAGDPHEVTRVQLVLVLQPDQVPVLVRDRRRGVGVGRRTSGRRSRARCRVPTATVIASGPVPRTISKSIGRTLRVGASRTAWYLFHTAGTCPNHAAGGARPVKLTFTVIRTRRSVISNE